MTGKFLGKITKVHFGTDGSRHSFWLELKMKDGNVVAASTVPLNWNNTYSYTHEEWQQMKLDFLDLVTSTLQDAQVSEVSKLFGKPVEVEIEGNALKSWRILTEVI